jgi:hypothetical protein
MFAFYIGLLADNEIEQQKFPLVSTLPAFIMKSSMVWSTLFIVFNNKTIRTYFEKENISLTVVRSNSNLEREGQDDSKISK